MPPPRSQAQARLFGAIAAGQVKRKGFSPAEARERLSGVDVSKLPARRQKRRVREALGY